MTGCLSSCFLLYNIKICLLLCRQGIMAHVSGQLAHSTFWQTFFLHMLTSLLVSGSCGHVIDAILLTVLLQVSLVVTDV